MSIGESQGGLPPDALTEELNIEECIRHIDSYHDASRHSMLHVALAPVYFLSAVNIERYSFIGT